ncbi:MAG: UrcA family protein [Hyphomonadaceae bacterium]|nr:UrcA family protein [Hyphomonadaceae bacterium]
MTLKSTLDAAGAASAAVLAVVVLATSQPAAAAAQAQNAFVFSYSPHEAQTAEGARALDVRLRRAARQYCETAEPTPTSRLGCQRSLATAARHAIAARSMTVASAS